MVILMRVNMKEFILCAQHYELYALVFYTMLEELIKPVFHRKKLKLQAGNGIPSTTRLWGPNPDLLSWAVEHTNSSVFSPSCPAYSALRRRELVSASRIGGKQFTRHKRSKI